MQLRLGEKQFGRNERADFAGARPRLQLFFLIIIASTELVPFKKAEVLSRLPYFIRLRRRIA